MLQLKNISKTYRTKNGVTHRALNDVTLSFGDKGLVFIVGRSGGGKSTLLNIIAALDKPDRGELLLFGNSFKDFSDAKLDSYRNTYIGVVFQDYNLIPTLNVRQNIALALGLQSAESDERVNAAISRLNLEDIAERKPNEISGGQSQRVAIARAIVKDPKVILADEPTGNLDSKTGREMFSVFKELSREKLVIIVTHDRDIADEIGDRVIEIKDGRVHKDLVRTTELYEPAIDTVGDSLIRVPKGKKLDELALEEINGILSKSERDTYIINESDTLKVKSMNLHVKNAVDINQSDNSTYYFPYRAEPEEKKEISLIKSKMPLSVGARLSASMLKYKKFRLVMTILMLIFALFLSALVGVFKFYNTDRAVAKTITKDKITYIPISKSGDYEKEVEFTANEKEYLNKISDDIYEVYLKDASFEFKNASRKYISSDKEYDYFKSFYGIVEIRGNELTPSGYTAGTAPETYNDVVISKLVARFMLDRSVYDDAADYDGLIGRHIALAGNDLKICGIYETDTEEYDRYKENREREEYRYTEESYPQLWERDGYAFVLDGFRENMISSVKKYPVSVLRINGEKGISASYISPESAAGKIIYKGDGDGVMLDSALFAKTFDAMNVDESTVKAKLDAYNGGKNDYLFSQLTDVTGKGTHTSLVMNGMKIKGVVEGGDGTVYVDNESFRTFVSDSISVDTMLIKTKNGTLGNQRLIKELKTIEATPDTKFYTDYMTYVSNLGMLSTVFSRLLVMISVAAALLLFSFISSSVKLESRQIGILRGMGARGIDTFKAFGIEGAAITAFALTLTVILIAAAFPLLNLAMTQNYTYHFYSIVTNPFAIILIIITAVLITAAAITIPLIRLVRMTPVAAMNKNETQR